MSDLPRPASPSELLSAANCSPAAGAEVAEAEVAELSPKQAVVRPEVAVAPLFADQAVVELESLPGRRHHARGPGSRVAAGLGTRLVPEVELAYSEGHSQVLNNSVPQLQDSLSSEWPRQAPEELLFPADFWRRNIRVL